MIKKIGGILVVLGLAVSIFSIILMFIFPAKVAQMPEGFTVPIIAFEFLQTEKEVVAFFGPEGETRVQLVEAMNLGHALDFIFLFLYGTFLGLWGILFVRLSSNILFYSVTLLAVVAALGDLFENIQLVDIANNLKEGVFEPELRHLYLFTWVKWGSLALAFLIIGGFTYKFGRLGRIITFLSCLVSILGLVAFIERSIFTALFTKGISLLFLLLFFLSILMYFRSAKYCDDFEARASL